MTLISRIGDLTIGTDCECDGCSTSGVIVTGASKTFCEGSNICRIGDIVISFEGGVGVMVSGASKTFCEGSNICRIGDSFVGCYSGVIVSGASRTHAE